MDQGNSGQCQHPYHPPCEWGQRPSVILRAQYFQRDAQMNLTNQQGVCPGVYLVRFDEAIFTGGAVQYQQLVNDTGGSPSGWMDFVSCCLESSATPLLDLQSDPAMTGYYPGLEQVVIRDFMMADALPPHFGTAAQSPIVSINCTQSSCKFDGLSIESAGMLPVAVRSYAGGVTGTTIIAAGSGTYSAQGVVDARGLPTGTWKQTSGAGWLMSGGQGTEALSFLPSPSGPNDTNTKPTRVIFVNGSDAHYRRGAKEDEPPTMVHGHLAKKSSWNPPKLGPGESATFQMELLGAEAGDATLAGHSAVVAAKHRVQLTANSGEDVVTALMFK